MTKDAFHVGIHGLLSKNLSQTKTASNVRHYEARIKKNDSTTLFTFVLGVSDYGESVEQYKS